jgi:transcriptional regulator with XRE-family HTH domain
VVVRAPQLYSALRAFCLGTFRALLADIERGRSSRSHSRSTLVREAGAVRVPPLVKPFIEHRAHTLRKRPDAQLAVEELQRQPAATIFARAHAGPRAREDESAVRQRAAADC